MQNNYELVRLLTEIIDSDINKQTISESMMYHISNNIPVREKDLPAVAHTKKHVIKRKKPKPK